MKPHADPHLESERGPIAWMARHSVAPNLLMILLLVGGFIFAMNIKQEVFPEFELDIVTIGVSYPGSSPEEVEQGIVLAIEEGVRGIVGVEEVTSMAREGGASITAEIEENADAQRVYQDIRQEVDRIRTLPDGTEEPDISLATRRRDVMDLNLYGDADEWVLREVAEQVRDQLLQHPGVTQVDINPERRYEVSIEIPQDNLRAYDLTLDRVAEILRRRSVEVPGGSVRTESGEILMRMKERRDWAKEFEEIPIVTSPDGTELRVRDLGTVRDTFEESYYLQEYNGHPSVALDVYRVGKQTPISVSDAVRTQLELVRQTLPDGIHIDIRDDDSEIYRQRLELLLKNGFMGLALVMIIMTIFLEYKLAFWVTMGIPISFLGAFLFLPWVDVTINMISMFAFIVALGIVVDDAIVVGENIFEYRQRGMSPLAAAIQGARDVATPVTFSIITNVAAFSPLLFVPGFMGKIWQVIPMVVSTVFIISLIESVFILPAHLAHSKRESATRFGGFVHRQQERLSGFISRVIQKVFGPFLDLALSFRYATAAIAVAILLLVGAYVMSGRIGMVMMPRVESDQADAVAVLPYGSPMSRLIDVRDRLVGAFDDLTEEAKRESDQQLVKGVRALIRDNEVRVTGYLTEPGVRPLSTTEVSQRWRDKVGRIEGLEYLRFQSDRGGPGSGSSLTVELAHRRIDVLDRASEELAAKLELFANTKDIDDGYTPGKQQLDFKMLPEGRSLGLTAGDVARQLRSSFYGREAIRQQRGRNEIRVMVRLPKAQRVSEYDIESFIVRTDDGKDVPLRQVATVERGRAYTTINRRDGRRTVSVTADVVPESDTDQVIRSLKETTLPELVAKYPGLSFSFQGKQESMRESMTVLRNGFIIAMMVIYICLGIPFRSYIQPMIVMLAIPFGIVGAVMGHIAMGYSLSIISMMGIIALSGVVVNDALVLIDYANRNQRSGLNPHDAILNAGIRRFRPIVMTTITTFGGLAPMIFETSRQARFLIPMAISLGYGILFATVITLVIVPCFYLIIEDLRRLYSLGSETTSESADQSAPAVQPA